jgi:hypothetical protein
MAYIGIGYCGEDASFLRHQVDINIKWLRGERLPRFFGDCFVVLYDSNTAREFAHKCEREAGTTDICIYPMGRPVEKL